MLTNLNTRVDYVHESPFLSSRVDVVGWIASSHPDVTEDNCTVQLVLSRDVSSETWNLATSSTFKNLSREFPDFAMIDQQLGSSPFLVWECRGGALRML